MKLSIDARRLSQRPLTFRPFLGDDHIAEVGDMRVGWILLTSGASGRPEWWWSMTGPCCSMARLGTSGRASSLEEAKSGMREAYARWLSWAVVQTAPVTWWTSAGGAPADALT
jgi:hypothetical protein